MQGERLDKKIEGFWFSLGFWTRGNFFVNEINITAGRTREIMDTNQRRLSYFLLHANKNA